MEHSRMDDLKAEFVTSVYESITKQIQHLDLKVSILLSWNGIIAIVLGREIVSMISSGHLNPVTLFLTAAVSCVLVVSSLFCFLVLKPRFGKLDADLSATGLLWSGHILQLGRKHSERTSKYLHHLLNIKRHDEIYEQYITSIVLISDIHIRKNRMFIRGLISTLVSFIILMVLVVAIGIKTV